MTDIPEAVRGPLATYMHRPMGTPSTSGSQRRKLVVSRDLGQETMSLLSAREDLEVLWVSLTHLIEAMINDLYGNSRLWHGRKIGNVSGAGCWRRSQVPPA